MSTNITFTLRCPKCGGTSFMGSISSRHPLDDPVHNSGFRCVKCQIRPVPENVRFEEDLLH